MLPVPPVPPMKMDIYFNPFPKYLQIRDMVSRWLGTLNVGDRLPTEEALSRRFGVSRITIRKALKSLESEGIIARRAGVGTWLAKPIEGPLDTRLTGPIEEFSGLGETTETRLIFSGKAAATPEVAHTLKTPPDTQIYEIDRVRSVDGRPFLLLNAYLPLAVGRKLAGRKLGVKLLVPILRKVWDPELYEAYQKIEAANADPRTAELLEIEVGQAVLNVHRVFCDSTDTPIFYSNTRFRADRYYYTVKLAQPQRS
jgi:GntR family transcriptional regulator